MKTTRLGKTNLEVSRVGIGGIPLTRPTEAEAIRVVQHALDLGINFVDTAHGYNVSEERIGKAIAGRRDQVIVATKGWDVEQLELSLKRLNTDYIDLWQFHGISSPESYREAIEQLEAIQKAVDTGKVRHIGFSSHNLDIARKGVSDGYFETVQFPFNFVCNEAADQLIPLAQEHDVGFIAMKPFAGGMLHVANLAIKYLLQFDTVVPDPGIERVEDITEIVEIVDGGHWELTSQERQQIETQRAELGTRFCRQCQYCMPCPEDVNIRMIMITQNMFRLWARDVFIEWMDEVIETGKNCVQCGECEAKCPYQLPIREMIEENITFYDRIATEHNAG